MTNADIRLMSMIFYLCRKGQYGWDNNEIHHPSIPFQFLSSELHFGFKNKRVLMI